MEDLKNRIYEVAKIYNEGNADWLTKMVLNSGRIRRADRLGYLTDDDIHDEVYYFEEDYDGDCFEDSCYGTNHTGTNPSGYNV